MRRVVTALIAVALVVAMIAYVATQRDLVEALRSIDPVYMLWLITMGVLSLMAQSKQYLAALSAHDVQIPFVESTGLTAVNTMANYYVPARGGAVVRAAYMRTVHDLPLATYAIVTIAIVAMGLLVAVGVGLAASLVLPLTGADMTWRLPAVFTAVVLLMAVGAVMAILAGRLLARSNRFADVVSHVFEAARVMMRQRGSLVRLAAWSAAVLCLQIGRLWLAFASVGIHPTAPEIALIGSLAGISFVLSITPGNLVLKEGITAAGAALVGIAAETALLAALIDRGAALVVTFGVGLVALPFLMRRATAASRRKQAAESESDDVDA